MHWNWRYVVVKYIDYNLTRSGQYDLYAESNISNWRSSNIISFLINVINITWRKLYLFSNNWIFFIFYIRHSSFYSFLCTKIFQSNTQIHTQTNLPITILRTCYCHIVVYWFELRTWLLFSDINKVWLQPGFRDTFSQPTERSLPPSKNSFDIDFLGDGGIALDSRFQQKHLELETLALLVIHQILVDTHP